jgi:methionyl-tRNA synthetase
MSKSLGNVIDPMQLLDVYDTDAVRYFLCAEIFFGNDGDFSQAAFAHRINTDLANDLGNLLQRALTFLNKHCEGRVPAPLWVAADGSLSLPVAPIAQSTEAAITISSRSSQDLFSESEEGGSMAMTPEDQEVLLTARQTAERIESLLEEQNVKAICDSIISLAKLGNRYIDAQAPWSLVKQHRRRRMETVLYVLMDLLRITAIYLQPITPQAATAMLDQMGIPMEERQFDSIAKPLSYGFMIGKPSPVFPKIECEQQQDSSSATGASSPAISIGIAATKPTSTVLHQKKVSNGKMNAQSMEDAMRRIRDKYAAQLPVMSNEELMKTIHEVGDHIRQLKLEKVSKSSLEPFILELKYLKER